VRERVKGAAMAHGGYGKKKKAGKAQLTGRREGGGAPGVLRKGADKQKNKKTKVVSIKNQIRGIERLLKKVKTSVSRVVSIVYCALTCFSLDLGPRLVALGV
jgi:hypothetical protein